MDGGYVDRQGAILQAVRALAPLVAEHRAEFDRARRLPEPIVRALVASDLFRLWAPQAVGGAGLGARELVDIIEEASALDASVGWIMTNGAIMSRMGGFLTRAVAQEWFSDPDCFIACSTGAVGSAQPVEGGYRVSGRWPFASGVQSARRVMGLAKVAGAGEAPSDEMICVYVPTEAARILDNWHVSGLRGTGSCDWALEDVFVPREHAHSFLDAAPTQPGLLYRLPVVSAFTLSVSLVPLGIAQGALADFVALAGRTRGGTSQPLREREMIQVDVARAEALRRSAKALILEALADLETALDQGGEDLVRARAFFRVALSHAAESCQRAVHMMAACAGTAAISEGGTLERRVRDIDAAVKHVAMGPHSLVTGGRVLLGLEPGTTRF